MCFEIHKKYLNVQIAKKDITCYKILNKEDDGIIASIVYDEVYFKKGGSSEYVNKEVKEFSFNTDRTEINSGLHTYSSYVLAHHKAKYHNKQMHKCIIPKGTKYYYNPDDQEYVSLKLKVFRKPMLHS